MPPRHSRSSRQTLRGAAAVELALLIVPFMLMTLAAIEFARIVFTYNQLVKVTRDAARFLSGFDPSAGADYPVGIAVSRVHKPNGTDPAAPDLAPSMIEVCDRVDSSACPTETFANVPTGYGSVNLVKVQISGYVYRPIFPLGGLFPPINFDTIGTTMRQVL